MGARNCGDILQIYYYYTINFFSNNGIRDVINSINPEEVNSVFVKVGLKIYNLFHVNISGINLWLVIKKPNEKRYDK